MRLSWLWAIIIILSASVAGLVNSLIPETPLRPIIVFWFLFVCPGMAVVRFLRLKELVTEWTLALALSFSIDALVAFILLSAGRWSPTGILIILIGFCVGSAFLQLALLLTGSGTQVFSWQGKSSVAESLQKSLQVDRLSSYPKFATSYSGTLHDVATGGTINITLADIQQHQGNISGHFALLSTLNLPRWIPGNGSFKGTVTTTNQIQFIVTSDTGLAAFSFDGTIQPDGTIGGTYRGPKPTTGKCNSYGLWSVSPGA